MFRFRDLTTYNWPPRYYINKISKIFQRPSSIFYIKFNVHIMYYCPLWQNIFFNGHKNVLIGFGSGQIHKYLASRIRNSGLEIWIRKKYLQIYNTASISLRFNLFLSYDLIPTDHKVRIYKEYHSVCPLEGIGTLPTPLSPARAPLPPETKGLGGTLACGWGVGEVPIPTTGDKA